MGLCKLQTSLSSVSLMLAIWNFVHVLTAVVFISWWGLEVRMRIFAKWWRHTLGLYKAQKKGFNGIWTHDLHDTGAMLYQLSYEALLEACQERVQFISVIWREGGDVHLMKIICTLCFISYTHQVGTVVVACISIQASFLSCKGLKHWNSFARK